MAVRSLEEYRSPEALQTTLALIFTPRQHIVRAIEHIDLRQDSVVRQATLEISAQAPAFLVPIAIPRKDQLIDTLSIDTLPGVEPATLGWGDTVPIMRELLLASAEAASMPLPEGEVEAVCREVPTSERVKAVQMAASLRSALLIRAGTNNLTSEQAQFFRALQLFTRSRPLLLPCAPQTGTLRIRFSQDVSQYELQWQGIRENVRASLGRLPDGLLVDIPLANRAQSYHFRLHAPPSHYIRAADCYRRIGADIGDRVQIRKYEIAKFDAPRSVIKGTGPDATGLCHVQLVRAGQHRLARNGLLLRIQVGEQPMGQLGGASVRLLIALFGLAAVWIYGKYLVVSSNPGVTSILLGLPGLLGVSFFIVRPATGVRGPLSARIGSVAAALGAIATSIVLAIWTIRAANFKQRHSPSVFTSFSPPPGIDISFAVVAGVLAAALVVSIAYLSENLRTFMKARRRFIIRHRSMI